MTPERWAQIELLFHRAAECAPSQRVRLLDDTCNGDSELRQEVEVLLANEGSASENMRQAVQSGLDAVTFPLIGETISHYRVLGAIGGGGMGLVYRAEDIKLGRQVALKFPPEESSKNPAAIARFEREARSASALEHPNICPVYEFGEHEGQPFLAMQLLEGRTLRELISAAGPGTPPLPFGTLLDLAVQIASGLNAAHRHGIIHRDIKPANIFVTSQGQAKILDFGLAKLSRRDMADEEPVQAFETTTRANYDPSVSHTGAAMGTAGYMSPEQVRGERLDARTDLFSFGLVLYEMAAGLRAPIGPGGQDGITLHELIRARQLNPDIPAAFEQIIERALEKDRVARYQSAEEILADLRRLQQPDRTAEGKAKWQAQRPVYRGWLPASVVVALVIVIGVLPLAQWLLKPGPPAFEEAPLTGQMGQEFTPAVSPDGNRVAFSRAAEGGSGLFVAFANTENLLQLTKDAGDCCPSWSPDGQDIAFSRKSGDGFAIYLIASSGGAERQLYRPPANHDLFDGALSWSPDGKALAFSDRDGKCSRIMSLSLSDSTLRALSSPASGHFDRDPAFSPDRQNLAFVRSIGPAESLAGDLFVTPVSSGEARQLTYDNRWIMGPPAWTTDSHEVVFSSNRAGPATLWRIPATGGKPNPVSGVGPIAINPSISLHNERLVYVRSISNENIWLLRLRNRSEAAGPPSILISSKATNGLPQFSPDGQKIAFESERSGHDEIFESNSDGSDVRPITSLGAYAGSPHWSPDGTRLAFDYSDTGHCAIYVVEMPDGRPRLIDTFPDADNMVPSWSRDGRWIYFSSNVGGDFFRIWKVSTNGGVPVQVTRKEGFAAVELRDGFLYYSKRAAEAAVWKMPAGGGDEKFVLSMPTSDNYNKWTLSEDGVYFMDRNISSQWRVQFYDFRTGKTSLLWTLDKAPWAGLTVSPDGKSIAYAQDDQDEFYVISVRNFR